MDWISKLCKSCSHDKEFLSIGRINESKLFYDEWKVVNLGEGNGIIEKVFKSNVCRLRRRTSQEMEIANSSKRCYFACFWDEASL